MSTTILHVQLDVATGNTFEFYRRLFVDLDLRKVDEGADYLGVTDERVMLILRRRAAPVPGGGRLGFRLESRAAVDRFVACFLAAEKITPIAMPSESSEHGRRDYVVSFEAPDTTRVEVAWFPL